MIKENIDNFTKFPTSSFIKTITFPQLPSTMKLGGIITVFNPLSANPTKWSNTLKQCSSVLDNFVGLSLKGLRRIIGTWKTTIDPSVPFETFQRCLKRLSMIKSLFFIHDILSKYQCGFRKGFSTQHCLIAMIQKWKKSIDNKATFGAVITDL